MLFSNNARRSGVDFKDYKKEFFFVEKLQIFKRILHSVSVAVIFSSKRNTFGLYFPACILSVLQLYTELDLSV